MDRLKVAVVLDNQKDPKIGGSYYYQKRLTQIIDDFDFNPKIEIVFLVNKAPTLTRFKKKLILIPRKTFKKNFKIIVLKSIRAFFTFKVLNLLGFSKLINTKIQHQENLILEKVLINNNVHLLYYLAPKETSINYSYIMTHWDLGHKSMYAFPEVTLNSRYELREEYHRYILAKAFAIFAESQSSKTELIEYERINSDRIFVVPLISSNIVNIDLEAEYQVNILNKWKIIKNKYFFYPAQFWSHKNHYSLIIAFEKVVEVNPELKLVLSGSDKGNLNYILDVIEKNNLTNHIVITGFVSDEEINTFYKNAICLIMPTFLGPTNMPLLEANQLGCPVLCSDLEGHREQLGKNAIYFDPVNIEKLTNLMIDQSKSNILQSKSDNVKTCNVAQTINSNLLQIAAMRLVYGYNHQN